MVNTQLFQTIKGTLLPAADAQNQANAPAYAYAPRRRLAQLAATGCLNHTFYANAQTQLEAVLKLAAEVDPEFVAKTAVYARKSGHMKDMPALLAAALSVRDVQLLGRVFGRVVDNGKMLRNFVQIVRSGAVGRKSLGSRPKQLVQQWLLTASEAQLLQAAVGNEPTLADVVKMVHPKPAEAWRAAWFAWLIGRPHDEAALPHATQAFERFKRALRDGQAAEVPDVPFQMLTALQLTPAHWAAVARRGSWQMVRQNLNTFARHGVFEQPGMVDLLARKLRDRDAIARARVLPYQLLAAYKAAAEVPRDLREALQDAMETSLANVPRIDGQVVVCPDVSGSMQSPVTGHRGSATTAVRCIDVAALVAAALVRKSPRTRVLPFEQRVVKLDLNPRDPVMSNAQKLASVGGGGTCVSAPLTLLNDERAKVDVVVIVSDNESWVDTRRSGATETMRQWSLIKARCPGAKLVCIDIQPYGTTQAAERHDVMNVGGFSDAVFRAVADFASGSTDRDHWVNEIDKISLELQ
ncbi:VWA domain-containing protein [Schlegelella sp. S2-27]|uniref:VWA domain-containing protein n=1 Tax=Caldimonas mangrovi TaxID=2944811 RepID=A0ABT0YPP1_9BURK|nr:VWA domain-containing protein [Caldimonas mangrovi]MCM5680638.1 VWA domain-containing protein [Caldimonas mangrovi]